jgi:hypothetical protein
MIAAAAGVSLVLAVLFSVYHTARRVYYDYYFYPRVKEEYIKPDAGTRRLDAIYIVGVILLLYLAYRLLKYALRDRPAGTF